MRDLENDRISWHLSLLKMQKHLKKFMNLVAREHGMTNCWRINCALIRRWFVRFIMKILDRGRFAWSLLHKVVRMNSFCHVSEALHGHSQHGDQSPTFLTWLCTGRIFFCSVTFKLPSEKEGLKKNVTTKLNTAAVDINPTPFVK